MGQKKFSVLMGYDVKRRQLLVASAEIGHDGMPILSLEELEAEGHVQRFACSDDQHITDDEFIARAEQTINEWRQNAQALQSVH